MGRRGPSKTPTAILRQRGSWRADTRPDEPRLEAARPEMPAFVTGGAVAHWDRVCDECERMGVLTEMDGVALGRYCVLLATWEKCAATSDVDKLLKIEAAVVRLEKEFGLTPASRANVKAMPKRAKDDKAKFFKVTG